MEIHKLLCTIRSSACTLAREMAILVISFVTVIVTNGRVEETIKTISYDVSEKIKTSGLSLITHRVFNDAFPRRFNAREKPAQQRDAGLGTIALADRSHGYTRHARFLELNGP